MAWELTPYSIPFSLTILCSLVAGGYLLVTARRRGWDPTVLALFVVSLGSVVWASAALVQVSTTALDVMVLAEQVTYVGTPIVVVGWFVFTLSYADADDWLTVPIVGSILAVLGAGTLLAVTNGYHQLLWAAPQVVDYGSFSSLTYEKTTAYYLFVATALGVAFAGIGQLSSFMFTSRTLYRSQMAALIVAAVAPVLVSLWVILGLGPHPTVEVAPIGFTVSVLAFTFAIERYQLLDLEPVARRRVVEHMQEGYLVIDDAARVVDLNPAAKRFLDLDRDAIGTDVRTVCPDVAQLVDAEAADGTEVAVDAGADRRYLRVFHTAVTEAEERLGGLVVLRDVTEQRSVERRYQELIERGSDLIAVIDERGRITYASPSHERILGIDPDDLEGRTGLDIVHPDDEETALAQFERLVDAPAEPIRFEYRIADGDGEWRVLEAIGRNLLDNPSVRGLIVNSRDVTARKRRERELERQTERLEDFANVVSHDLRNPLEIARLHLREARRTGDEESFETVADAHERIETIISDVLELARQDRSVGETQQVALSHVADEAWQTVETDTASFSVTGDHRVEADPERLRRLFENLFRNAIEHAGPDVAVSVGPLGDGGFYVADDGPGLPADRLEAVFESGVTTGESGTGFGLPIVRQIAQAHGWRVRATNDGADESPALPDGATGGGRDDESSDGDGGARFEFRPDGTASVDPD
jgi:PAS domain S-box-containing protein